MDKQRYLVKIQLLRKNIDEISSYLPESEKVYSTYPIRKYAIERLLQVSIEIVLDLCAMLIADLHLGPPEDEDQIIDLLHDRFENIENIKILKRFRNILVHKYGEINNRMVYQNASENLGDFESFIEELLKIIE
jgi:uncharacterized protein YutE (UPF0331/DUF86 family)